jgi:hypothetical protein
MSEIKETNEIMLTGLADVSERELTLAQRAARLLSVKSLVTIILTSVYAYLSVTGKITPEQFMTVFVTIIAFYFGTQAKKE